MDRKLPPKRRDGMCSDCLTAAAVTYEGFCRKCLRKRLNEKFGNVPYGHAGGTRSSDQKQDRIDHEGSESALDK